MPASTSPLPEEYLPEVSLLFNPDELTQAELSSILMSREAHDDPRHSLHHALVAWELYARRNMLEQIARGAIKYDNSSLAQGLDTLWQLYLPIFQRTTVPSLAAVYVRELANVKAGNVDEAWLYGLANEHAKRMGDYFHESSKQAVLEGFNAHLNRRLPRRAAAERVMHAYGLTPRQMRGAVALNPDGPVLTSVFRDVEAKLKSYIGTSLRQRLKIFTAQEEHNLQQEAQQIAWLYMVEHGRMSDQTEKVWFTQRDERVCGTCGPLHGVAIPIVEKFETSQGPLWVPGAHVNCRCEIKLRTPRRALEPVRKDLHGRDLFEFNQEHPRRRDGRFAVKVSDRRVDPVVERLLADVQRQLDRPDPEPLKVPTVHRFDGPLQIGGRFKPLDLTPPAPLDLSTATPTSQPLEIKVEAPPALDLRTDIAPVQAPDAGGPALDLTGLTVPTPAGPLVPKKTKIVHERETEELPEPVFAVISPTDSYGGLSYFFDHNTKWSPSEIGAIGDAAQLRRNLEDEAFDRITDNGEVPATIQLADPVMGVVRVKLEPHQVKDIISLTAALGNDEEGVVDQMIDVDEFGGDDEWLATRKYSMVQLAQEMGWEPDDFRVVVAQINVAHQGERGEWFRENNGNRVSLSGQYQAVGESEHYNEMDHMRVVMYTLEPEDPKIRIVETEDD